MELPFDHRDKTVFIAGAISGINLGLAHCFTQAGTRIGMLSRSPEKVETAVAALKSHRGHWSLGGVAAIGAGMKTIFGKPNS